MYLFGMWRCCCQLPPARSAVRPESLMASVGLALKLCERGSASRGRSKMLRG